MALKMGVLHKRASRGVSIAFPDVCLTPGVIAGAPGPIPYPNFAKTALKSQKKVPGGSPLPPTPTGPTASKTPVTSKTSFSLNTRGPDIVMMGAPTVIGELGLMGILGSAARHNEATQLKGALNQLNGKLQGMTSKDPNEWQKVLQDYAVAASALYVTLNSDNDD